MTVNAALVVRPYGETANGRRDPHLQICSTDRNGIAAFLDRLSDLARRTRFQRNETIFAEHDAATHIYYVAAGCVRLCRHVADGRRHISEFMFAGDVLGLGECCEYPHSAEAVTSVTAIAYPKAAFDRLGENSVECRTELMRHLSAMLAHAEQRLFRMSCQSARERTASFIVQLWEQDKGVYGDRVDLPMGRQEIADHLGLTIETICRSLASLRAAGTLDIPNAHQLVVKLPDDLRAIAEGQNTH